MHDRQNAVKPPELLDSQATLLHEIELTPVKLRPEIPTNLCGGMEKMQSFDRRLMPTMMQLLEMQPFRWQILVRHVTSWRRSMF
jgi:hypothetical protein